MSGQTSVPPRFQLTAQGEASGRTEQIALESGRRYTIGRAEAVDLRVPWEPVLSGRHVTVTPQGAVLRVERLATARNPVFFQGQPEDVFIIQPGDQFVIGETRFRLTDPAANATPSPEPPLRQMTFTRQQLRQVRFADADRRMDILSRLPDVIACPGSGDERDMRLVGLVLAGIRQADGVALVETDVHGGDVTVAQWERRHETAGAFRPSTRLVSEALRGTETILHLWNPQAEVRPEYTLAAGVDWAFCLPLGLRRGRRWGLYVTGRFEESPAAGREPPVPHELESDVRFAELVGDIVQSVMRVGSLEGNLAVLRQFLAPPIIAALERTSNDGTLDDSLLEPRECFVTVLFCDLRGFTQRMEGAGENLNGLLDRVSAALEIMTRRVTRFGGVTGDFLGDATLGFWGWPFASEEAPLNACRAALDIRRTFEDLRRQPAHPLSDFEMGIGIAHGRAVAGKIGTSERVTVTVFGPVVNLASRLEGLTKQLHVPILLDEATAEIVRDRLSETEGRTRRLARLQPYGMESSLVVSELLPSETEFPELTAAHLSRFEEGVDHFLAGRWEDAYRCFHEMPSSDRAQDFLTLRIAQTNRRAPPDWDGIIRMPSK